MLGLISLQHVRDRSEEIGISVQVRAKSKSCRIVSRSRGVGRALYAVGAHIAKRRRGKDITVIRCSKSNDLISSSGKARIGQINILERRVNGTRIPLNRGIICICKLVRRANGSSITISRRLINDDPTAVRVTTARSHSVIIR